MDTGTLLLEALVAVGRPLLATPGTLGAQVQAAGAGGKVQLVGDLKALAATLSEALAAVDGVEASGASIKRRCTVFTMVAPARDRVLFSNEDVTRHIMGFVDSAPYRGALLSLMGICRVWRAHFGAPRYWRPILRLRRPLVAARMGPYGDPYGELKEQGRVVVARQVVLEKYWADGLDVEFELWNAGCGTHIYSIAGPARLRPRKVDEERQEAEDNNTHYLSVVTEEAMEVNGEPFRPREIFYMGGPDCHSQGLAARVVVKCRRTGRRAVLWENGGDVSWVLEWVPEDHDNDEGFSHPGLEYVSTVGRTPLRCGALVLPDVSLEFTTDEAMQDPAGGGVRYSYRMLDKENDYWGIELVFRQTTNVDIGRFVHAVLEKGSG